MLYSTIHVILGPLARLKGVKPSVRAYGDPSLFSHQGFAMVVVSWDVYLMVAT